MNYLFSIVVPAKNEEAAIGKCLRSIHDVDFSGNPYEIIVVDNGSEDRTVEIARQYADAVFSLPGATISALRNYGAEKARGEYLAFVDGDVTLGQNWAGSALSILSADPSVACVGCSPATPGDHTWVERAWNLDVASRPTRSRRRWIASANMIVRSPVFRELGGFNENLITCEDVDLGYRITERYTAVEDKSIAAVHLGGVKTLAQLFKKEIWRGKSSLAGLMEHGLVLQEIPSLGFQVYYLFLFLALLVSIFFLNAGLFFLAVSGSLVLPLLRSAHTLYKLGGGGRIHESFAVWWVYHIARGVSLVCEAGNMLKARFRGADRGEDHEYP